MMCCAAQQPGKAWLVGAGIGSSTDHLTCKAARLVAQAEVLVYDDLGAQAIVEELASPGGERHFVGKRGGMKSARQEDINKLLVRLCQEGKQVVRLKGGCPSVFSRVGSEMQALQAAGIPYELVPGVSSALAAPLLAGFPLTDTTLSTSFTVATAHDPASMDWQTLARAGTLVLLMAGSNVAAIMEHLQTAGRPANEPVSCLRVVVIRAAGTEEQQVWRGSIASIAEQVASQKLSPCIVCVGHVSSLVA
eukprot:jgi/Astpho2/7399/Aster-01986